MPLLLLFACTGVSPEDSPEPPGQPDDDEDGVLADEDCDDGDALLGARQADQDCDGAGTSEDCDDDDPASTVLLTDADCDGWLTADDCDDADPSSSARSEDADCDGTPTAEDCDDGDPASPVVAQDADCDGAPTGEDCDDRDPTSPILAQDADCDGTPTADDCDDRDVGSTVRATDADCDGRLNDLTFHGIRFVHVPPGTFQMGCVAGRDDVHVYCYDDQFPAHDVQLTRGLWMSKSEITQEQHERLTGQTPSLSACADCPVQRVDLWDAMAGADALSLLAGLTPCGDDPPYACGGFRLPTEAEWEYAARAGEAFVYSGGNTVSDVAWHGGNSGSAVHPVCQLAENAWGLCDMTGNVYEWTRDQKDDYVPGPQVDPEGGVSPSGSRVCRGGSYASSVLPGVIDGQAISFRYSFDPEWTSNLAGYRLVRVITGP